MLNLFALGNGLRGLSYQFRKHCPILAGWINLNIYILKEEFKFCMNDQFNPANNGQCHWLFYISQNAIT
jgi:hypothetical protein